MEAETAGIVISSGAVGALCGVASTWIKSKLGVKRRRPLDSDDLYVTAKECKERRCAIEKRIDTIVPTLTLISNKLDEIDDKAEKRSTDLHRRLDPVIEKVGANSAELNLIKQLAVNAAAGGKK